MFIAWPVWPLVDCASASATTGVRPLSEEKTGTLETTAGATLLTNIAELKALLGDAEGELELYLQAKVIREKTGTLHSAAGAVVLSHLGGIYARREELDVALQWLQLAREAREKRYQPGGLAERSRLLRQLVEPKTPQTMNEVVEALRGWRRSLRRAQELEIATPDATLLLGALDRMSELVGRTSNQVAFRMSSTRATLGVDVTPNLETVLSFSDMLTAEAESLATSELQPMPEVKTVPATTKVKAMTAMIEEKGEKGSGKAKSEGKPEDKGMCPTVDEGLGRELIGEIERSMVRERARLAVLKGDGGCDELEVEEVHHLRELRELFPEVPLRILVRILPKAYLGETKKEAAENGGQATEGRNEESMRHPRYPTYWSWPEWQTVKLRGLFESCVIAASRSRAHKRIPHPDAYTLSIDTAGPFELAEDQLGKGRYLLVGVYLVPVAKDGQSLIPINEEHELPGALGDGPELTVVEDGENPEGLREGWPGLDDEKAWTEMVEVESDFQVKQILVVEILENCGGPAVVEAIGRMAARLDFLGFPVKRLHSDRAGEYQSRSFQKWCHDRSIMRTFNDGDNFKGNGRAENAIAQAENAHGIGQEFLQTRMVGLAEVRKNIEEWKLSMLEEYGALVHDSEAVEPISREEVDELKSPVGTLPDPHPTRAPLLRELEEER
eukprot:g25947.t1